MTFQRRRCYFTCSGNPTPRPNLNDADGVNRAEYDSMRVTTKVLFVSLSLSIALMGCKNPCEDAIDEVRDEITAFLVDSDPFTPGNQPCQDEICAMAAAALDTRWPHFDCTSCDAA